MLKFVLMALVLTLSSCQKDQSPEGYLKRFIDYRFSDGQKHEELLEMTSGELRNSLVNMDAEELKTFLTATANNQQRKFKMLHKNCSGGECFITYVLNTNHFSDKTKTFEVETKKTAKLVMENENWLISEVDTMKTYIEGKKEIIISK